MEAREALLQALARSSRPLTHLSTGTTKLGRGKMEVTFLLCLGVVDEGPVCETWKPAVRGSACEALAPP